MAENVLKIGRSNTFRFEGTVNVTDKTFVINKTNDKGTWVQNRMSLAIDCGEDGYNFVTLNGGYNPKGKNIIYLSTVDEDGKFLGKEHNLEIDFNERDSISQEDFAKLNMNNLVQVHLSSDEEKKVFITQYDAVEYLHNNLKNGTTVVVKGTVEETISQDGEDWFTNHIVNSIEVKNEDLLKPSAFVDYTFLVDDNVVGQPNLEDKNVPLFFKGLTYIRKVGDKKYNQVCAFPKKVLYEANDFDTETGRKKFTYGVQHFFTPAEKGFVDELQVRCRYKGGARTTTVNLEDLPKNIQEGIAMGFVTEDQIMANAMAISGSRQTELVFVNVKTRPEEEVDKEGNKTVTFKILNEKKKYKTSEVLDFEALEPISDESEKVAPTDNYKIDDDEINETAQNILNMFASFGN